MAYQIKKTSRITEDIELLGESGNVEKILHVEINPDGIMNNYRKAEIQLLKTQRAVKEGNSAVAVEEYGKAVTALFETVFGTETTAELLTYFENKHTEMLIQLMPFITDVVRPAVAEAIKSQKSRLANNMNFSRRQKRKLGLK